MHATRLRGRSLPLAAVLGLTTLLLLGASSATEAQSCCTPDPCGPTEACTEEWSFGPDGEAFCTPRCSPRVDLCNHDGHCDAPDENLGNCWDDCCVPTRTCDGRCGSVDDGCGHTLDCGSCEPPPPCNGNGVCDGSETFETCPAECPPPPPPCNGNGVCEPGEGSTCSDCQSGPVCGNGILEAGEDCASCPADAAWHPTFTISPSSPMTDQPVTLTAAPELIDNPPTPLWDLGDTVHREGNPFVYSYANAGSYTIILTASEKNCHTAELVRQDVTVRPRPACDFTDLPPQLQICCGNETCDAGESPATCPEDCGLTVSAGGPYDGVVGQPISFQATADTTDAVRSYRWTFGDGAASSESSPGHVYDAAGSYTVTVAVSTARATGTATALVTVHPCNGDGRCDSGETDQCSDCVGQPLCGNGVIDPGEDCSNCPRDVARQPTFTVSPWAPFVGDAVVFTAAADLIDNPGHPLWDLGNTQHVSGNPYTYTYPTTGSYTVILTAAESRCHTLTLTRQTVNVRPRPSFCDFSDLPPQKQVCCGNETCDAGETPADCPSDCGQDLEVTAGGPYHAPAGTPVSFLGTVTTSATVTSYLWNFGDGGFSSESAPSHVYATEGEYGAQLLVTTSAGSGAATAKVTIGSDSPREDDARLLDDTFPPSMVGGASYPVSVTVENTGQSTWVSDYDTGNGRRAAGFALAAKSGHLIPVGTRFTLPSGRQIPPGMTHTFYFDVIAPPGETFAATELQMVNEKTGWFGEARYLPVNIGESADGAIRLDPTSGPPGTLVTVTLVTGPPFPDPTRGRFSFGDPGGASYSIVRAPTTRLSPAQATFVVPGDAGCGEHYFTIIIPRDGRDDDPPHAGYRPERFTVTSPCDPTRRNSLDLFTYNIQLLPNQACSFGYLFGGAPTHSCVDPLAITCDDCHKDERVPLIAHHPELQAHDVIVFEEAWSNFHRDELLDALKPLYPYQSPPLGGQSGSIIDQNGGVVILSKWPIEATAEHVYSHFLCSGFKDDCRSRKGVLFADINKAGLRYRVLGTHTDSGKSAEDRNARLGQLGELNGFMSVMTSADPTLPVLLAGDFNIDRNSNPDGEYDRMLSLLNLTHPPTAYGDAANCPSPLPPPPPASDCGDDLDCEKGQEWYVAFCEETRTGAGRCRYNPTCLSGIGTNLDGDWIDYVLYPSADRPQPVAAQNLVLRPTHPDSPYPGRNLSDHFAVLGRFRYAFPEVLPEGATTAPSAAPAATAPAAAINDPTPTFSWSPATGASSYTLSVNKVDEPVTLLQEAKIAGTSFTSNSTLPSDVDLHWEVRGENQAGVGPSSGLNFRIERSNTGPPTAAPIPAWPLGTTWDVRPRFSWSAVAGAGSYDLLVATVAGQAVLLEQAGVSGPEFVALAGLPVGPELLWSVRAESASGPGPFSEPAHFTITLPPANRPPGVTIQGPNSCMLPCNVELTAVATDPDGDPLTYAWAGCDAAPPPQATVLCSIACAGAFEVAVSVSDGHVTVSATKLVQAIQPNRPPSASVGHSGSCAPAGCTVTFTVAASDPDGDPLSVSWSGCGTGTGPSVTCARSSEGALAAQALVTDGRGASVTAVDTANVYVAGYNVGAWSACAGAGLFTCTSNAADGCSRPGSQSRSVAVASWILDTGPSVTAPGSTRSCTEIAPGYIAGYNSTYTASWTCTAGGATGCYKDRGSYSVSGYRATAPDAAVPASRIYTYGYVSAWNTGPWSGCSASCGGGWQTRSVTPAGWRATPPDAGWPADGQACNEYACVYTCYDFGWYPTWAECYDAGWPYCDTRYHDDGTGNIITCRHGYE